MMRDAKNIWKLLLVALILIVGVGCNDADDPIERLRPSLSVSQLSLEVGDSAMLQVVNADTIISTTTDAPQVVMLRVEGTNVIVKAIAQGEATVAINVKGARLKCDVTVIGIETPQDDFDKELLDERCRFVSPSLSLYYDTPGTIVSVTNGNVIEMRSLITGDNIIFNLGEVALKEGTLPNATLQINGNSVELKQATLEHITTDGSMWLNLLDDNNNRIIIVVTDI
jgi:hypothetical protein